MNLKRSRFWLGVVLMIVSFVLYPGYALVAFLPITPAAKVEVGIAGWAVSWSCFAIGATLAGPQGVRYVREVLFRWRAPK